VAVIIIIYSANKINHGGETMAKSKGTRKAPRVVTVKKHTRKNGDVVPEHKRSKPDGIKSNNHSD